MNPGYALPRVELKIKQTQADVALFLTGDPCVLSFRSNSEVEVHSEVIEWRVYVCVQMAWWCFLSAYKLKRTLKAKFGVIPRVQFFLAA